MRDDLIEAITKNDDLEDELFEAIFDIEDNIERQMFIEAIRRRCKSLGRTTEFNNLLKVWQQEHAQELRSRCSNVTRFTDQSIELNCGRWIADDTGVYITDVNRKGESFTIVACPHPILPVERFVNIDTDTEKVKLEFFKDSRWRDITVNCGTISNKSYISNLADRGVLVTSESASALVKYINECISDNMSKIPLYRSISRFGWVGEKGADGFAPYIKDIKYDGDLDFKNLYEKVKAAGDEEMWMNHILELRKNINIRLMLDVSFGSVLIQKLGALPFVLHLWGTTGFGKTVSLMVAASVWGNPELGGLVRTMNMTTNAMARTASFLYNIPFCADELQQIKDRWNNYDSFIMYITEGMDRGRAKAFGGVEEMKTWRNAFILTGEEPVTKSNSGGGAKNRCIEIEVREKIIEDGNLTANLVKENYGYAGKRFLDYISTIPEDKMRDEYKRIFTKLLEISDTTEKQAMSMAVILLADRYACECLFHDKYLTGSQVKQFMISQKDMDISERAYNWLVNWVSINMNRFDQTNYSGEVWGKIEKNECFINKLVLQKAMAAEGFEFDAVKRNWFESGKLIKDNRDRYNHWTTIGGIKSMYVKISLPDEEFHEADLSNDDLPFE